MKNGLLQSVVAATSMSLMTTVNAQENSTLDIGRFAIAGYGDVTYINQSNMKDETGNDIQNNVVARFVPIFLFQLSEKIHIEAELEFSTNAEGETETELEYANMHYFFNDNTIITAGKFLLPFGQFGVNLHPSWINKAASNPGLYGGHGGNGSLGGITSILGDTGINIANTWNLGDAGRIFTDFYTVSGPRQEAGDHGGGVEMSAKNGDNNNTMAFGGRIAYAFLPEWEVGVSYYSGKYSNDGDLNYDAYNIDFNWVGSYASVRGEIFGSSAETEGEDEPTEVDEHGEEWVKDFDKSGWYIQGTWQARELGNAWLNPVEFVVRYSDIKSDFDGSIGHDFEEDAGKMGSRIYYGVNYWLEPSAVLKLGAESTSIDNEGAGHGGIVDDRVFLQLAFGF
jgi:hypothetical protein|tara:strand:+ start:1326 stop:2513 length:1188 start_codon:yes stop_codon:yes gene_type:complete